jgi:hypothetical protein
MRTLVLLALPALLFACRAEGTTKYIPDRDGDGINEDEDCDDADPRVGAATTYYYDSDADGHGDAASGDGFCDRPEGYAEVGDDCDDTNNAVYPGAEEICDELDNDCDGVVDNGAEATAYYTDADGDGYGDDGSEVWGCEQPAGTATVGGDCNDADPAYNPGATEEDCEDPNDYNCDGSVGYADADGDGFAACAECNDGDAAVHPDATEVCNGDDDDCDGLVDDDDDSLDLASASPVYADLDADGYGDPATAAWMCDAGPGWVTDATDCDDLRPDINPGATEACNGYDDDCDGLVDDADDSLDASTGSTWYTDADGDGYGDDTTAMSACEAPAGAVAYGGDCNDTDTAYNPGATEADCTDPNDYNCDGSVGYADNDGDGFAACEECDDANAANYPGATEVCDGADNDCDGTVDEADAVDASTWYADADTDGYGDPATAQTACDAPAGFVADATDCDDTDTAVNPASAEVCDGVDNDCDGTVDEDTAADASVWYADADGDGFGDAASALSSCSAPSGYVADGDDCDDTNAAVSPSALELCNGLDDDCDGDVDEDSSLDVLTWYADADGDGFGDAGAAVVDCDQPAGYVDDDQDCDDTDAAVSPDGMEVCDGVDNDCDGTIDEDSAADAPTWYADADGDGYGDPDVWAVACEGGIGTVDNGDDCDDTDAAVNPDAIEVCDNLDNDCDGGVDNAAVDADTWYADADGDGYGDPSTTADACDAPEGWVADNTDCVDTNAAINPAATEICDGIDNDCDGVIDTDATDRASWYADTDGDGYGDASASTRSCSAPAGYVASAADCDDTDAGVNPAATEVCDGVDNDCDGSTDPETTWWDPAWPYRILLTVSASSYAVDSPPVLTDIDFGGALTALGATSAFDSATIRVVTQSCTSGQVELPSQYEEDHVGLLDKLSSEDTESDYGTLAFLLDADGDLGTLDPVAAGSTTLVGVYFGGSATDPGYSTDLVASSSSLGNDLISASFDSSAGGLLQSLTLSGSSTLESQTSSCCGNSFYGGSWNIDPQDGTGSLALLFDGPVMAAVEASGSRSDSQSGYTYSYIYLAFAGRPELYSKVYQVTDRTSTLSHPSDFTSGIRPWETRRDAITSGATFTTDSAYRYADVSNGSWGMSFAYVAEPTYLVGLYNYNPYLIVVGNDYAPAGSGTPGVLPADTAYLDHVVQVHLPHAGDFDTDVQDTLFGLVDGVSVAQAAPEAH